MGIILEEPIPRQPTKVMVSSSMWWVGLKMTLTLFNICFANVVLVKMFFGQPTLLEALLDD